MRLVYSCPSCEAVVVIQNVEQQTEVCCNQCSWKRDNPKSNIVDDKPQSCLVCGCDDLWRQKDFPVALGLAMVGLGIIISSICIAYYRPILAMAALMAVALVDMVLFQFMKDVLVCYRCNSRHRSNLINNEDPAFNLEISERYRQEQIQEKKITSTQSPQ